MREKRQFHAKNTIFLHSETKLVCVHVFIAHLKSSLCLNALGHYPLHKSTLYTKYQYHLSTTHFTMKILTKNLLVLPFLTTVLSTQDSVITEDGEVTTLSDSPDLSTELDDMTETQIKSSLSKLVGFMDTDKDKNISYEELLFWVFRSIHSLDARNSKQTFREADSNRDDQLAFDEFLTYSAVKNVGPAPKFGHF